MLLRRTIRHGGTRSLAVVAVLIAAAVFAPGATANASRGADARANAHAKVMQDAGALRGLIDSYWTADLASQNLTFYPPLRYEYYYTTGNSACDGAEKPWPRNAYYCYPDRYVAFDVNWLASFLEEHPGGATTFLILAHEWGHAVQDSWMRQQPGVDWWAPAYRQELQADCLAGVFMRSAIDRGAIIEEAGDGAAVFGWLAAEGSGPWTDPGGHGTAEQRQIAFSSGYERNSAYCRQFDF